MAVWLAGCVTGPVRSVTVGHAQSATVRWTSDWHPALMPVAIPSGIVTDIGLCAADTLVKTGDNLLYRPMLAYGDMWRDAGTSDGRRR